MSGSPFDTLLFDLDGTLLDIDMPAFLDAFFRELAPQFGPPAEHRRIGRHLISASQRMFDGAGGQRTLARVFLGHFAPAVGLSEGRIRRILAGFHHRELERLRPLAGPRPGARELLEHALALGYDLALATNPVFFLEAIRARVRWAGLEWIPFRLITSAERMHWSKPHRGYYLEVLRHLHRPAARCLMAGDDPHMDLAAAAVGIAVFQVDNPRRRLPRADGVRGGSLEALSAWLDELGPARR